VDPFDPGILLHLDALLQEGSVTRAARRVGLSTPAMSHALARLREQLDDPLLVRAGRGMVLTPRAEALRERVHAVLNDARRALAPPRPFRPSELERTYVIRSTDYVLVILGLVVDRLLREEAPGVCLRFLPNTTDDPAQLREGTSDLAVGIYGELPQELRHRQLLTDRFVCAVRQGHPTVGKRLSLDQFTQLAHIQIAPRGLPGGYIDDVLRGLGRSRRVARAVPTFLTAMQLAAGTDYLLTVSERVASTFGPTFGLRILAPPVELRPYALSLLWHPRFDGDEAHEFLRGVFVRAANEAAGVRHQGARTRLDMTDPTSGQTRKRPRKPR
jgi:DNA-binding transcriptional LysR family regulator